MKRFRFFLLPVLALSMLFAGCQEKEDDLQPGGNSGSKSVGTFKQADLVEAVADMYAAWEENTTIPEDIKVGETTLTKPQYIYAMAKLLVDIKAGSTADIDVLSYKAADHPERDSYDALEIAVYDGPKNGDNTEDLGNIATRMIATMADKGQVPNQTLFDRDGTAIAYSTNRATVTFARAISEYSAAGEMPEKVSTDYLSAAATLKGFATQFVTYLDVWEENVAEKLSADGSRCSDNNTAWEYVHFIPIPASGGYADGVDQYDPKYQPYHTIEVDGVTYDAAQCWGIALKGILDLITLEGSSVMEVERNPATPAHTLGNGKGLNAPIPTVEDYFIWGKYPWYEKADDPCVVSYNEKEIEEVDLAFLVRLIPWHLTRSSQLAAIGNFQTFGDSPESTLIYEGYKGNISPMRELLIAARFYKYLLDNDITSNVYDAMKDVKISADLYGSEQAPITVSAETAAFEYGGGEQKVTVTTKDEAWTATVEGDFITVTPTSGEAGATEVTIVAAENNGGSRTATVTFSTASGVSKAVTVTQAPAPTNATIKEFAQEYVKVIGIWNNTVGTVNYLTGIGANNDEHDVPNAHYIPAETTITVGGVEYNTADMLELAERSYLLLRGYDGHSTTGGNGTFETVSGYTMDSNLPETHSYIWGGSPFNETGKTTVADGEVGNGGGLRMGDPAKADGVELVKVDILDNFAQRHLNWPIKNGSISNMCGYAGGRLAGYYGCFSAQRALLTYAYFFQYMLDNNLDDAMSISADQTFKTYLFGDASVAGPATIKDFATEYVKLIDVWENTTGTVNYMSSTGVVEDGKEYELANIEDAHYIPLDTKITVGGVEYSTNEVIEIALRSYLLLRGYDATVTDVTGAGNFAETTPYKMSAAIPEDHDFAWGSLPYNESPGNGGGLRMGSDSSGDELVKVDLLDNFAMRNVNYPKTSGSNAISNLSGYVNRLEGYYGCCSAQRALLTYAYFFEYMLDNNLEDAASVPADQTFKTYLFGEGKN